MPGEDCTMTMKFIKPMAIEKGKQIGQSEKKLQSKPLMFVSSIGARFTIRDGEVTLGTGVVTEAYKPMDPKEREVFLKGKTKKQREAQAVRLQELEEQERKKRMEEVLKK